MNIRSVAASAFVSLLAVLLDGCAPPPPEGPFDTIIRGGQVVDGTGAAPFQADVGVYDGRITFVGDMTDAVSDTEIDATGLVVAPGFIDIHSHATSSSFDASGIVRRPDAEN